MHFISGVMERKELYNFIRFLEDSYINLIIFIQSVPIYLLSSFPISRVGMHAALQIINHSKSIIL